MFYRAAYSVIGISGIKRYAVFLQLSDDFSDYLIMFELKKVLSSLAMPLPALLIIGFIGLALIMFSTRHRFGVLFVFISLTGIFLVSFQPVSTKLLMPMEREHIGFLPQEKAVDYVMVLGSGHVVDHEIPPTSELSRTALMRLIEGIRIQRMYPGAKLILSGYAAGAEMSHAKMLARVALALGVTKTDIVLLETAKDTWEEARQAAAFVKQNSLVLVTSASHMTRALAEFHAAGMNPIPAPTNYLAQTEIHQAWTKYTPSARYLEQSERYWHEKLGIIWADLRDNLISTEDLETQVFGDKN
ncbi:envelope biogenesis factor ElyC [Vibrio hannami]|uniref:envelope biogenesis factor ElyC n=1 Tax=Vibrio hannami TaxID=2717094 RepID=UPI00240FE747|nr:envelope biogenesis factor ElyC [Vibrio hannami]MDG3088368.1 envelope biogenesis factor ElyC [Vibrio hannami]